MQEGLTEREPRGALLRAGFAERDITPGIGMEIPGTYLKAYHTAFHDACKVRAAVFDDGCSRVALVGVDALMIPRAVVEEARAAAAAACGIAPGSILLGASHSHTSGPVGMIQPGEYDDAPARVRELAYGRSSCADPAYLGRVRDAIVEAIVEADARRVPARCGVGEGVEDRAGYNRRFRMRHGWTWTHPGAGNPDIVEVAGPVDPAVGVMGAWDEAGAFLGCVVNYACHATTHAPGISANWIHEMERVIRGALGAEAIVVYLQGYSGDITQVDNLDPEEHREGKGTARFVGGRVGAEAVKVLVGMEPGALGPVGARVASVELGRRVPDPERLARCAEIVRGDPPPAGESEWVFGEEEDPVTRWVFAKEIVLLDAAIAARPRVPVELQAVRVGPAVFLANPGEVFCEFGLELRRRSPFPFTFPVGLANGCVGYIPTEAALGEGGGGYETRLTSYSNLEPGAGRALTEASVELIGQLGAPSVPGPGGAPFHGPWIYGSVRPELR